MARKDDIRDGVANTGGVSPSDLPRPSLKARKEARKRYNARVREVNERRREQARETNADRRAAAKAKTKDRFTAPSITANRTYQRAIMAARDRLNQSQAGFDDQEKQLGISYGLGNMGGSFASNPYSRAALLQRSYDQNQRRTQNSMASAGQLYSGATQSARNFNNFNYGQAGDALRKDFGSRVGQIGLQRQGAQSQYGYAMEAASDQAIDTARRENPVNRLNAPRAVKPKLVRPKLKKFWKPINRPKGPGPTGGATP